MAEEKKKPSLPSFFDKKPELKRQLEEYLATVPEEEKIRNVELVQKFISGEITWAEIKHIPKKLLKQIAVIAYNEFKAGDYKRAEILFKGLAVLDHNNWYYRAALGAIFQRLHQYEQAVQEYDIAIRLNPDEITSLVNRGQCHLKMNDQQAALEDFMKASQMPLGETNPWIQRAQILSQALIKRQSVDD